MEIADIKEICLTGSRTYYNYLAAKPNGGVDEVDISKIEQINHETFKVEVTRKLFDVDSVCFSYNGKIRKTFTTEDIQIKVYDNNKRTVVVKVSKAVQEYISSLNHREWKLIIDLKFLVQRVIDWYEQNGNYLKLNSNLNNKFAFDESVIFDEHKFKPSKEQHNALKMIFSKPVSYVWGAPGTGKTRFVLSYSILSYIKKKEKVLVLAPTNVALEQVLSGVLEMTDKSGLDRKQIIRLGFPSQEFVNEYGEICEIQGLEKELKRVNDQIKILSSILGIENDKETELKDQISKINQIIDKRTKADTSKDLLKDLESKSSESLNTIKRTENQISILDKEENHLIEKKNSIVGKVFRFLSKQVDYDKELERISTKKVDLKDQLDKQKTTSEYFTTQVRELKIDIQKLNIEISDDLELLEEIGLVEGTLNSDLNNALANLKSQLSKEIEDNQIYKSLSKDYENFSKPQLSLLLKQFQVERKRLEDYSLDSRIENALVIGSTIDTYLHRFKEKRPDFAHIFLDEAGYASVIKAMTIFNTNSPVTFLGDHKQLPPVCEVSKSDIQKNEKYREILTWDQSAIFIIDFWNSQNINSALNIYLNQTTPSKQNLPTSSLTESFRFGPNLASVLDHYVYEEGFKSKKPEDTEIIICNVANPQSSRGRGRLNEAEAITIQKLVDQNFKDSDSVAVLAPYRDQIKELNKRLPEFKDENKILTVHKSQGREWDTVIYSVCDIGNGRSPWFTDSTNTLSNGLNNVNTAVSRAKKRLIICCNKNEWLNRNDQLIKGLLDAATREINFDSSQFTFTSTNRNNAPSTNSGSYDNSTITTGTSNISKIKGKDYVAQKVDEEWESKTLYWSKLEKSGYIYSKKKDAWWKKK
ncbi:MAG TPA: AAA domain-containing protein [Saprospiraceae bacterium]|nr:hypothetical protein [Saprospiraceae bacterium]MCB9327674.1 hypothetical protein [Lewinellaceae bacterium]HRX29602.1 AAA domain-containing protein [Saprospiraceae bacterium]